MSSSVDFGVNGRYLTQPVTGVQRYARNVIAAMNEGLAQAIAQAPIIAPSSAHDPGLSAMPLVTAGPLSGHVWEQLVLPARWPGRLLNLCNTAPALKADQVVCIHDTNVFVASESYGTAFRATYRLLQPLLAKRAATITTVSVDSARQISRYLPVRVADIVVLPDGHEHALAWNPSLARAAPSVVPESGRRFVFAVGSRARHKNLQLVLNIAPELAAMGFDVIVAGGDAGIYAAEGLANAPTVKMLGYVTDHDLAYLMDHALCLLFPSWTEGFGLPIVEAMARGCPVISSDRASIVEVCGDAALLAAPDDPAKWIRQVHQLATSQELQNELSARGRERVQRFSWSNTATGYIELMREPMTYRPSKDVEDRPLPKIAVIIATRGRGEIVTATLTHLLKTQTLKPVNVIVSCVAPEDAGNAADLPGVTVVLGAPGLPTQRNAGLAALSSAVDVVAFFDDDFVADTGWLEAAARVFRDETDVVGFTGHVVADGIHGPGLSFDHALNTLGVDRDPVHPSRIEPFSPYGSNMAFRLSAIGELRFDERLVLYGWQEDRDFGAALAKRGGRLIKSATARGVHMGVKAGRVAGDRLGYSQIVNPIYLFRKGTMTGAQAARHIFGNVVSNLMRAPKPEPFVDRRGRLRGNLRGFADVLRGRIEPERAAAILPVLREQGRFARTALSPSERRGDGAADS
jgi:glycosyltransferase involved in cell wall biosynthesis